MYYLLMAFLISCLPITLQAQLHPIQFSISETKIVDQIPEKDRDFAFIVPGDPSTYIYTEEEDYFNDYQRSYFAFTGKKGGWDCMRHYEILANGCIPYFVNLENAHPNTMYFLPKQLIQEAMQLPGVSHGQIDHSIFDKEKYYEILGKLLEHTRKHLSAKNMAAYILETMNYQGTGDILYLSHDTSPDYMRCGTLVGFKELLGPRIIDVPKIPHIYKTYPDDVQKLYGRGFTYSKIVDDYDIDREGIEQSIINREFDLIIYGSVHRGLDYHSLVLKYYKPDEIIYICGEDDHTCVYSSLPHLFLREYEAAQ